MAKASSVQAKIKQHISDISVFLSTQNIMFSLGMTFLQVLVALGSMPVRLEKDAMSDGLGDWVKGSNQKPEP